MIGRVVGWRGWVDHLGYLYLGSWGEGRRRAMGGECWMMSGVGRDLPSMWTMLLLLWRLVAGPPGLLLCLQLLARHASR